MHSLASSKFHILVVLGGHVATTWCTRSCGTCWRRPRSEMMLAMRVASRHPSLCCLDVVGRLPAASTPEVLLVGFFGIIGIFGQGA